ncbi:hypothetical protein ALC60_13873 [Trachymyrmex zeteki]|uniref:Uncharacterized protein n=1 Tax=Mycetomoellerius zeteki TaxID=64791 RepID=A0A151WH36_9HYME|nr:hypothetical protein ALC60_13873 [Trachymyrmex zeteki]
MTTFNVLRLQLPQFLTTLIFHRGPLELSLLVIFVDSSTIVVRAGLADGIARTSLRDFIALVSGVSHERALGVAATTFWPSVRRMDPRADGPRPIGTRTQRDAIVEFVRANRPLQRGCRTADVNPWMGGMK